MESRLPKPKAAGMKKSASATEVNSGFLKVQEAPNVIERCAAPSTSGLKVIGKSKSTLNIDSKSSNENKPPTSKPTFLRSQTSAAIAMNKTKSLKRLGTGSSAVESKRPNVKPICRPPISQRVPKVGAAGGTTGKAAGLAGAVPRAAPKPSKWDLKGRLELVTSELSAMREKNKKTAHLASAVEELKEKETTMAAKIEELEGSNATLADELSSAKKEYEDLLDKHENLETEFKQLQESHDRVLKQSKKYEDTCASQRVTLSEHAEKVRNLEDTLNLKAQMNEDLNAKVEELRELTHQMDKDRRVLHNAIQELKGNIRVFCRVRPKIAKEMGKAMCAIHFIDESTMEVGRSDGADVGRSTSRGSKQEFTFDKIFPPTATQAEVFEELSLLVQSALEGYNVCVFAYGQTGSGKTYTMEGCRDTDGEGMIPRTVRHIFEEMKQFELLGWEYRIEASFLEIYNEHIVDLLDSQQKTHEIRMADTKGHDLYVSNLQVEEINSPEELHECLLIAQKNRAVAATFANERSSRSHSVARIRLIGTHAGKDEVSIGNLNLVDLAGSERLKGEEAVRTAETKNINKSLANLGNVILALLKKQDHIPYRNSKLTHLLMPSLGGNSKTLMLLNVSPLDECFNETLNSLRFASNVNNCKTGNVKRSRQMLHNSS